MDTLGVSRDHLSARLRLKRLVGRRNGAVVKYRKLLKARVTLQSDSIAREIAEQLAMIDQLNAEIERLQGKPSPGSGSPLTKDPSESMRIQPDRKEPK